MNNQEKTLNYFFTSQNSYTYVSFEQPWLKIPAHEPRKESVREGEWQSLVCAHRERERVGGGGTEEEGSEIEKREFLVVVGCRRSRENISKAKNIEAKIIRAAQPSFEKKVG